MYEEKLRGEEKLDMERREIEWTVNRWDKWRLRNRVGLVIEDGHVTGYEPKEVRYHI